MTSWRISALENNTSAIAIPTVGNRGATVIRAGKGPTEPILISKGGKQRIINIFGNPSVSYPDTWEAIEYNNTADLWVSAPVKGSYYYGGVAVTKTGTIPLLGGYSSISSLSFAALPVQESLGVGDGSTTTFTITLTNKTYYVNQSVRVKTRIAGVDTTLVGFAASNAATEILSTSPVTGSGTYVRASGVLTFTFSTPPASGTIISAYYTENRAADIYFLLFENNPKHDDTGVLVTYSSVTGFFTINTYLEDVNGDYNATQLSPYTASLVAGTKDGFGANVYIEDVFTDDDFFTAVGNPALTTVTTTVDDVARVNCGGGFRGAAITLTELTTGWNYFQSSNAYAADILFDVTAVTGIDALFLTLRTSYQKYKAYILAMANTNASTAISSIGAKSHDRGLYYYWNWAKVTNTYTGTPFWTTLIGRVAAKHAAMVNVYNGLAPSWIDENGHGGQLGGGVIEMAYDPSEGDLQLLDTAGINPIILDPNYGTMVVSDKTSVSTLSDYSYIGHSRVADFIMSNIINQVLPFQLTKLNDTTHRTMVKSQADNIISPLLRPPYNLLRDAYVKCDEENNDDTVLALRQFILWVAVKFTPFSETIKFVFTNVEQSVDVKEVFGG